ncbi:hypothetical protein HRbin29_00926 [bacterium HR29]|jgi:tight adherence protein B|nr:hypothetical protein HRbin29_00926 [bacterium HR29]
MEPLAILAASSVGAAAAAFVAWLGGAGRQTEPSSRLERIRAPREQQRGTVPVRISLRRRAAVQLAGLTLVPSDLAQRWTLELERAGLTLTPREYFTTRILAGVILAAVIAVIAPAPALGLAGIPVGFFGVRFWVQRRIATRRKKLESQLVELLSLVASGLRAGFGFIQALDHSAQQLPPPLSVEIRRTLRDISVGASVEQALQNLNERVGSPDFDIVITAVLIQRQVGGNLAEILDNVAHTMRERDRIRGEIRTLTAQQRLTGYVIGGIPIGLLLIFSVISPDFTSLLFTDPLGRMMLGAAAVMEVIGFFIIRNIVNIEV